MTRELLGGYPPPDGREQMGRFLRHAYSLPLNSFIGLVPSPDHEVGQDRRQNERDLRAISE